MQPTFSDVTIRHERAPDGLSLRVMRWGSDADGKPPMLLAHATGFPAMTLRALAEALAARYDVWSYDQLGHGASDKPPLDDSPSRGYGLDDRAEDLVALLDALGLEGAYAVGHSGGATAVLEAVSVRPQAITRVLAYEAIIAAGRMQSKSGSSTWELSEIALNRRTEFPSRAALLERWSSRPPFGDWRPDILNDYVDYGFETQSDGSLRLLCPPELESAMFAVAAHSDPLASLGAVECPALLLVGERPEENFGEMAAYGAAAMQRARVEAMPKATHFLPMEDPARLVRRIVEFGEDGSV